MHQLFQVLWTLSPLNFRSRVWLFDLLPPSPFSIRIFGTNGDWKWGHFPDEQILTTSSSTLRKPSLKTFLVWVSQNRNYLLCEVSLGSVSTTPARIVLSWKKSLCLVQEYFTCRYLTIPHGFRYQTHMKFKTQVYRLLTAWPWMNYLTSLYSGLLHLWNRQ